VPLYTRKNAFPSLSFYSPAAVAAPAPVPVVAPTAAAVPATAAAAEWSDDWTVGLLAAADDVAVPSLSFYSPAAVAALVPDADDVAVFRGGRH
jgi:hypothetical protein